MPDKTYFTKEEVYAAAKQILHKSLRDIVPATDLVTAESELERYGGSRKGYLGELIEKFVFGLQTNNRSEADFLIAGVELKTTPLKKSAKKQYVSKERLVFSMIDYDKVIYEKWETSSFLQKNKILLLMFYLYIERQSILDYEFKFIYLLNLLEDISAQDVEQIKKDWEFIVAKIRRGEAHLLSEGDTFYLGACTKAKNSLVLRDQPKGERIPAKPRAFSLKQTYLNYLIQKNLLGKDVDVDSLFRNKPVVKTVEEIVDEKFGPYLGKDDTQILSMLDWAPKKSSKNYKRLIVNRILTGTGSNTIEEFEKANITLKVVTLEASGVLKESISFPAFDYKELVNELWYDDEEEMMSEFHAGLEMNKFLFVVFQKEKDSKKIFLKKVKFWNFPMEDLDEAERVFNLTKELVSEGRYSELPKISESKIVHVRPHAANAADTLETPQHTQEVKRCFWLNAKYIQGVLEENS